MPVRDEENRKDLANIETEDPWGENWNFWSRFAAGYGTGPVSVAAKNPSALAAAALAIRRWNQATGMAVFRLAKKDEKADVTIKVKAQKHPEHGADAQTFADGRNRARVRIFRHDEAADLLRLRPKAALADILVHEFGHTLGLQHDPQYHTPGATMGYDTTPDSLEDLAPKDRKWAERRGIQPEQMYVPDDPGPSAGEVQRVQEIVRGGREIARRKKKRRDDEPEHDNSLVQ